MKVILTSFAMDSHFNGVVPLAWALQNAGHEVRVASQPDLVDSICRAGLPAVCVGDNHKIGTVMRHAAGGAFTHHSDPRYLYGRFDELDARYLEISSSILTMAFYSQINNDTMVDDLVEFTRAWKPDLIIWEPFTFAGSIAATATGTPHARLLWGPDLFRATQERFNDVRPAHIDDPLIEWLTWTLRRHNTDFDDKVLWGDWSIDTMPPAVRLPTQSDLIPMRYIPYNGPTPAVHPSWLTTPPTKPRVCLTQGFTERTTGLAGIGPVRNLLAALADLDIEVVATASQEHLADLTDVSPHVRVVSAVSMQLLLPTCTAVIHHGGAGTWATAATHAVPQISMAWQWDDVYRAHRIDELGAGRYLPPRDNNTEDILAATQDLLTNPTYTQASQTLATQMRAMPLPSQAVTQLETII